MRGLGIPLALLTLLGTLAAAAAQDAPANAPAMVNPNPLSSLSLDSLTATRALPLFTPSRTPPAPPPEVQVEEPEPVAEQVDPEQPPPSVQLIGIVLTDATQTVLLRDPASNEVHRLTDGGDLQGWAVKIIDSRSVELRSGERVQGLKMFETFSPQAEPQAQPPYDESRPPLPPPPGGRLTPSPRSPLAEPPPMDSQGVSPDADAPPPDAPPSDAQDSAPGGDAQSPDSLDVPSDSEAPPPEESPPVDFAPKRGNAPIPEEGSLSPDSNGNNQ